MEEFYVLDFANLDFKRLFQLYRFGSLFFSGVKFNTLFRQLYSHRVERSSGLMCDQTIMLIGVTSRKTIHRNLDVSNSNFGKHDRSLVFRKRHTLDKLTSHNCVVVACSLNCVSNESSKVGGASRCMFCLQMR